MPQVCFKVFRSALSSWKDLFEDAAAFASTIPPEWLISISHSADRGEGVVTVWYWATVTTETIELQEA
jgi:hypothetical protein